MNRDQHHIAAVGAAVVAIMLSACEPGTGGETVTVGLALTASESTTPVSENALGWTVELEQAYVAVGPIFVYENPPPNALASRTSSPGRWLSNLLVSEAHAHPGDSHFNGGNVRSEWLGQAAVNALSGNTEVGPLPGIAGDVGSLSVHLEPPRSSTTGAEVLQGHHAYVVGTATREDMVIPFEGGLDIPQEGDIREVRGVPISGELSESSTVRLSVQPHAWFAEANFERLLEGEQTESGRYVISEGNQVYGAWLIGIRAISQDAMSSSFSAEVQQ